MEKRQDVLSFFEFEKNAKLFDYEYKGVKFWTLIRTDLIYSLVEQGATVNRQSERGLGDYIKELLLNINKSLKIFKSLKSLTDSDLFVSGSVALRKSMNRGKIYQYFPFLERQTSYTYVFHSVNVKEEDTKDGLNQALINLVMALGRVFARVKRLMTGYRDKECKRIASLLEQEFQLTITDAELERDVEERVLQYKVARWYYTWILGKFRCRAILLEAGYAIEHFALCEVAHKMGIPVVELQHGILNSTHPAYNYCDIERDYTCLPDYVFTWGDVWSSMIHMPSNVKIITCGYPYFDINGENVKHIEEKNCITFFTNLHTEKLTDIALELESMDCDEEFEIVVKFHPYLHYDWELNKDKFKGSRIKVINDASTNIYELIARSRYCVGYSSTVLFETIAMGKMTYAMKVDGMISKDLEGIEDILLPIDTAQALYESMMSEGGEKIEDRSDKIMKKHAEENILNELGRILEDRGDWNEE